mgnify:CR=1 FL=1
MAINHGSVVAGDGCDALTGEPLRRTAGGIPRFKPLPAADGLILTKSQAEAVYSAMCALNNVNGIGFGVAFNEQASRVGVREFADTGRVLVERFAFQGNPVEQIEAVESYADQSAFATAYGLQQG